MNEDEKEPFSLTYSEALVIRRCIEHCLTPEHLKFLLTPLSEQDKEEAHLLQWKIKDAVKRD